MRWAASVAGSSEERANPKLQAAGLAANVPASLVRSPHSVTEVHPVPTCLSLSHSISSKPFPPPPLRTSLTMGAPPPVARFLLLQTTPRLAYLTPLQSFQGFITSLRQGRVGRVLSVQSPARHTLLESSSVLQPWCPTPT